MARHANMSLRNTGLIAKCKGPTLTSFTPATGAAAGGTATTLAGTNFRQGMTVVVGGVSFTSVVVVSKTSATAVSAAHAAAGPLTGVVTNPLGGDGHGLASPAAGAWTWT